MLPKVFSMPVAEVFGPLAFFIQRSQTNCGETERTKEQPAGQWPVLENNIKNVSAR